MMRLYHGDCLEIMRGLPDASVDAVVTDPPYGLEFMGKEWDGANGFRRSLNAADVGRDNVFGRTSRVAPEFRTGTEWKYTIGETGYTDGGERLPRPSFSSSRNPMCRTCHKHKRGSKSHESCVCPSPDFDETDHHLAEMGLYQAWSQAWATEVVRVLKPGGYLVAFGGTRTYHRMACAIEDAGFVVKDSLCWLYGQGFPKSRNLGDGIGTALKPAHEPIIMAQKPMHGTYAANAARWGVGGLDIDGCRIAYQSDDDRAESEGKNQHTRYANPNSNRDSYSGSMPPRMDYDGSKGRWPANVVLDEEAAELLNAQSGTTTSRRRIEQRQGRADESQWRIKPTPGTIKDFGDTGGASRFFYCAKASRSERNAGLDGLPLHKSADDGYGSIQRPKIDRAVPRENWEPHKTANHHPTVKPVALMRWLVRMVTPVGGVCLDLFLGSGTTGVACVQEGRDFIGIERERAYFDIAERRIAAAQPPLPMAAD